MVAPLPVDPSYACDGGQSRIGSRCDAYRVPYQREVLRGGQHRRGEVGTGNGSGPWQGGIDGGPSGRTAWGRRATAVSS
jgi:hypothetical protein